MSLLDCFFLYKVPFFKTFDLYQPCYYVVKLDPLEITCICIALKICCWIHLWKFEYSLSLQQTFVSVLVICLFFLLGLLWLFHLILIDCVLRRQTFQSIKYYFNIIQSQQNAKSFWLNYVFIFDVSLLLQENYKNFVFSHVSLRHFLWVQ